MFKTIALYGVFIFSLLLYLPAVNGPYLLDDFPNLIQNESLILEQTSLESLQKAATSSGSSFLGRPIAMLSFALNYTLAGDKDTFSVKLTNILLHLATGIGIFFLLRQLLRYWLPGKHDEIFWIALLTTALWLIHPLQISTVLYTVQRMTVLSALFTVFGLIAYLKYRAITLQDNSHYLTLFILIATFTLLGVMSKENAILLPVFALLIEMTVFRFAFHPHATFVWKSLVKLLLFLPVTIILVYLFYTYLQVRGEIIWPYSFTIDQRLLSQPRILLHYLGWISLLNPEPMSFYHPDLALSKGLLQPVTTLLSITSLFILAAIAVFSLKKQYPPILAFAIIWFFIGHLLESTSIPLMLVFEHRNYLPSMGILLLPAYFLVHTLGQLSGNTSSRILFSVVILLVTTFLCYERVNAWRDEKSFVLDLIRKKSDIPWVWGDAAGLLSRAGDYPNAIGAIRTAARLEPSEPAFILGEANIRCQHQPETRFPDEFIATLRTALSEGTVTPTTVNSFVGMIRICQQTRINNDVLGMLYAEASRHDMDIIADIGRRAIEIMDKQSGQE